jgi:PKD repeat protein
MITFDHLRVYTKAHQSLRHFLLLSLMTLSCSLLSAQQVNDILHQYLESQSDVYELTQLDIAQLEVTSQHTSRQTGVTHVYVRQMFNGLPVANGIANFAIKDGKVVYMGNRLIGRLEQRIRHQQPSLLPDEAIYQAAQQLKLNATRNLEKVKVISSTSFMYSKGNISTKEIPVQLMYHADEDGQVHLVWDMIIHTLDGQHWWTMQIDAVNGELISQHDLVVHCSFETSPFARHSHTASCLTRAPVNESASGNPDQYNVLPLPAESPNHGTHAIVTNPADLIASPFGWHDTDGVEGAEYTITRGNNVYAYEDADNDNEPGFSPDGTSALDFNFPYLPGDDPVNYQSAAITNLFYMNNMMHDIWYQYGFDEVSGNFQDNNYSGGGEGTDFVLAEAQDGGGLNNANFGTPVDGSNPRMQMYLWQNTSPANLLLINSPADIAGEYLATPATFGPALTDIPITADIVLVADDVDPINDGCNTIINGVDLNGKIALVDRGTCTFVDKVQAIQNAGAIAVIIANNIPGDPIQVGGNSGNITIPSIMISQSDGDTLKSRLSLGPINGSISDGDGAVTKILDGDFDNGIIAHEYGHGISNRLVGGMGDVTCLNNAEQMGEGWSDWFGLMLTMEPGDQGTDIRGIGTFAVDQVPLGTGIRPAPYSTDFNINGYTYGASNDVANISQPHGVGFIFATMLWDLTWALVDAYGGTPDPDLYTGTGGNNIAMQLVIEGLKMTSCRPGMVDGRNAILAADRLLYDGAHQCLIWEVFARRGLGFSADQKSSGSRTDQVEAFDLPTTCQTAVEAPVAAFTVDSILYCSKTITFFDSSYQIPQEWQWDFGDGQTSAEMNPTHTYALGGTYIVKLVVTNTIGKDSTEKVISIELPETPAVEDQKICSGDEVSLVAGVTGKAIWKDTSDAVIFVGDTLHIADVQTTQTYYILHQVGDSTYLVGPKDGSFGNGGYHGNAYFGATNFIAERDFYILTVWVDAAVGATRTFTLATGVNEDGSVPAIENVVQSVDVFVPAGQSRITLNMQVPGPGDYYLGSALGENAQMFRNNFDATFPYSLPGYLTMTSSSASTNPFRFFYYLYDWEIGDTIGLEPLCLSNPDTVTITPVLSQFDFIDDGNATLFFTDQSVGATSWHWDFGDGDTSAEQNPVHTYADEGEYTITLTINDGLCSSVQTYFVLISGSAQHLQPLAVVLQPNPSDGWTTLQLTEPSMEDLQVEIKGMDGKMVDAFVIPSGQQAATFSVAEWPATVYVLSLKGISSKATRRLVVTH